MTVGSPAVQLDPVGLRMHSSCIVWLMPCILLWQMWPQIAPGIKAFTKAAGFPMALTFKNSTDFTRLKGQPLASITTEPAAAAGSAVVNGQDAGSSSSSGGLSSGASAGIAVGIIAVVALLAALAAFGFLRLRKQRQQEAADRKLKSFAPAPLRRHKLDGSTGSTSG